ncbi:unnamed protein product [Triticum turgidum subsp. durum]|uniref:Uncharacterized protein n=1 Tax=Triticum turgidum subsp. durum TaxID=4567 RepID=A0A9R0T1K6_TRITD|nr:unnamed protein product [Triticum turgidum subsp. durum]
MAEEPSAKRHHAETSDKRSNLVDIKVPGEKRNYTRTLEGVELHGKETLEIICTSEPDKAGEVISRMWRKLGGKPKRLTDMLQHDKLFTFAGFSIETDKEKLKLSGMEINPNKFIDIERKWRVPYTEKEYDSLTDVAASVIHPFYKGMKNKINTQEDYKLWGTSELPDNLIEYAGLDAYAAYKSWFMIDYVTDGLEFAKEREANNFYGHPYCPF